MKNLENKYGSYIFKIFSYEELKNTNYTAFEIFLKILDKIIDEDIKYSMHKFIIFYDYAYGAYTGVDRIEKEKLLFIKNKIKSIDQTKCQKRFFNGLECILSYRQVEEYMENGFNHNDDE